LGGEGSQCRWQAGLRVGKEVTGDVVSFNEGAEIVRLRQELREWRRRNDMAYQDDWDTKARQIIFSEIRRIRSELRALTGSPA
jgi:hypothetical protein